MEEGCERGGMFQDDAVVAWTDTPNRKGCTGRDRLDGEPPITQSSLGGVVLCGTRGGEPFASVTRPDANNQCPAGTSACSSATSAENTVCYPDDEKESKCPITSMRFELTSGIDSSAATAIRVSDEYSLVFSKSSADSLPITSTQMAFSEPCMVPSEVVELPAFYPTEIDRNRLTCSEIHGRREDSRYEKAGDFQVSEYDLQLDSGVLEIIKAQPMADNYVGDYEKKKEELLSFWTRPTIQWSLTCEGGDRRQQVLELAAQAREATAQEKLRHSKNVDYIFICALVLIPFGLFAVCAGAAKFDSAPEGFIGSIVCFLALFLLTLPIVVITGGIMSNLNAAQESAIKLNEATDGCVAPEAMVDMGSFDGSTSTILSGCSTCHTLGTGVIVFQVMLLVASGVYHAVCVYYPFEEDKEHCERERIRKEAEEAKAEEESKNEIEGEGQAPGEDLEAKREESKNEGDDKGE